jgi:hypothetical protein
MPFVLRCVKQFLRGLGVWNYALSSAQGQSTAIFQDTFQKRNEIARNKALRGVEALAVLPAEVPLPTTSQQQQQLAPVLKT